MSAEPASRVPSDLARSLAAVAEIAASRERVRSRLLGRERLVTLLLAGGFCLVAVACALWIPSETGFSPWVAAFVVGLYAVLAQIEFEVGPGSAVPTELVLVPMLFVLPAGAVPLCVAAGLVAAGIAEQLRSHRHSARLPVLVSSAWHSVGPAVVIGVLAPGPPTWDYVPVYVLGLFAQLAFDVGSVVTRHTVGRAVPVRQLAPPLAWVAFVDCMLAPVALLVAAAAVVSPAALVCVLPLAGLLHALGAERRRRIDESLVLGGVVEDAAREARLDPLTGVGNRLAWQEAVAKARPSAAVVLVDLDRLKETNDTHGHDMGDRLIRAMGEALRHAVPEALVVARIGGDEFALLLPAADDAELAATLAAIRTELAGVRVGDLAISASVGAAASPPSASIEDAIALADERLYADKDATRLSDP